MAPVSHCVDVADSEAILQSCLDSSYGFGNFSSDEGLLSEGTLVVECQSGHNEHLVHILVELNLVVVCNFGGSVG